MGVCPFGESCFYSHKLANGQEFVPRIVMQGDGERRDIGPVCSWSWRSEWRSREVSVMFLCISESRRRIKRRRRRRRRESRRRKSREIIGLFVLRNNRGTPLFKNLSAKISPWMEIKNPFNPLIDIDVGEVGCANS